MRGSAFLLIAALGACSQPAETQAERAAAAPAPAVIAAPAAAASSTPVIMRERAVFAAG